MRTFGLTLSRILLASLFIYAGVKHFANAEMFASTVPPYLGFPFALVYVSGVFEVIGGIGMLIPNVRHYASWLLMALLIAVFPANIYMATDPQRFIEMGIPLWALYFRLPLQFALILWVWWCGLTSAAQSPEKFKRKNLR